MNMYKSAIASQCACNVSGLVHGLCSILDEIWKEAKEKGQGTDYVNQHPVVRLFAEQIYFLSGKTDYMKAYEECERRNAEEDECLIQSGKEGENGKTCGDIK